MYMTKKKEVQVLPLDLTEMTDDEIRERGIEFLQDLIDVLEKHKPFYMARLEFRYLLEEVLPYIKKRLAQQEYGVY